MPETGQPYAILKSWPDLSTDCGSRQNFIGPVRLSAFFRKILLGGKDGSEIPAHRF
jgi:hypothetical protein